MTSTPTTLGPSIGLGLCLALAVTPLGCGSPAELPGPVYSSSADPTLPAPTIAALTACTQAGAARLTNTSYAIIFDVDVEADGRAQNARVKDSIIGDRGVESCMVHALDGMSLPASIVRRAGRVSAESRRYVGNAAAPAPALVALGPIGIAAAGITILVLVTVYVVSETATATRDATDDKDGERERCKKVKQSCIEYCSDTTLPTRDLGWSFQKCKNECLERHGCPRDS